MARGLRFSRAGPESRRRSSQRPARSRMGGHERGFISPSGRRSSEPDRDMNHPSDARPVRVLVADDNVDSADSLSELVKYYGADVRTCYDGLSALAEAERFRPDVCLFDLNMPGMDGDQLAVRVRELMPDCHMKFAAVTAMN